MTYNSLNYHNSWVRYKSWFMTSEFDEFGVINQVFLGSQNVSFGSQNRDFGVPQNSEIHEISQKNTKKDEKNTKKCQKVPKRALFDVFIDKKPPKSGWL